jgi:hypothetical protein
MQETIVEWNSRARACALNNDKIFDNDRMKHLACTSLSRFSCRKSCEQNRRDDRRRDNVRVEDRAERREKEETAARDDAIIRVGEMSSYSADSCRVQ